MPNVLAENAEIWQHAYHVALENYRQEKTEQNKKAKDNAEKKYNHKTIKKDLIAMHHDKCAYCESKITHVDDANIEHFRPKSLFPEQCFQWENLLLGCSICNGKSFKGNKFPLEPDGTPSFIKPDEENPEDFFVFDYNRQENLVLLLPRNGNSRAKTMIRELGLNREKLATERLDRIKFIAFAIEMAKKGNDKALELLNEARQPSSKYSAWVIALCRLYGIP